MRTVNEIVLKFSVLNNLGLRCNFTNELLVQERPTQLTLKQTKNTKNSFTQERPAQRRQTKVNVRYLKCRLANELLPQEHPVQNSKFY